MGHYINGVKCDTYVYLDQRRLGSFVHIRESDDSTHSIVAFFYCNDKEFPISSTDGLTAYCHIRHNDGAIDVECNIGTKGEIIIPVPKSLCVAGQRLSCEINVNGTSDGETFRYRAFDFYAAVIP